MPAVAAARPWPALSAPRTRPRAPAPGARARPRRPRSRASRAARRRSDCAFSSASRARALGANFALRGGPVLALELGRRLLAPRDERRVRPRPSGAASRGAAAPRASRARGRRAAATARLRAVADERPRRTARGSPRPRRARRRAAARRARGRSSAPASRAARPREQRRTCAARGTSAPSTPHRARPRSGRARRPRRPPRASRRTTTSTTRADGGGGSLRARARRRLLRAGDREPVRPERDEARRRGWSYAGAYRKWSRRSTPASAACATVSTRARRENHDLLAACAPRASRGTGARARARPRCVSFGVPSSVGGGRAKRAPRRTRRAGSRGSTRARASRTRRRARVEQVEHGHEPLARHVQLLAEDLRGLLARAPRRVHDHRRRARLHLRAAASSICARPRSEFICARRGARARARARVERHDDDTSEWRPRDWTSPPLVELVRRVRHELRGELGARVFALADAQQRVLVVERRAAA